MAMPATVDRPVPGPYWTAEMVRALPDDGNRYEVVYGELLVSPAPRWLHQRIVVRLAYALETYLRAYRVGEVLMAPADISWGRKDVLVQPDVFVVPVDDAGMLEWSSIRHLLLVAEVLSPSNPDDDRFTKRRCYQEARVPLYWIVDADEQYVEIWRPDDFFWHPEGAAESFTLELAELFRPI
jgi:Uma2 family endonuclease